MPSGGARRKTRMTTRYVIDTHALVWFLEENPRLGSNAKTILEDPTSQLVIPIIVLAEACWMIEHGKTSIPTSEILLDAVDADPRVSVIPLDQTVLSKTSSLRLVTEMHDRQIVATALLLVDQGETVALLTRDGNIRDSGLVSVVW